ncbi:2TM domain-containing protein [Croceitalea vernalis]|uniref:2TM domain-containing protein n=1 Tax=Croceitalea vernalis TaxID=3075599 RepID=A0ABU3BIH6_9FLAO|nr:2TM domain-containing protein [Croceitalea sp. P007]MDT0621968.1 2TM domain-containing protein [Croceitalea sp. P007]
MENINEYKYNKAVERVKCIKSFYTHLTIYFLVISALAYINYSTTSFVWVIFPAVGWGLGLISHGLRAFGQNLIFGKDWEERKIKELIESDKL